MLLDEVTLHVPPGWKERVSAVHRRMPELSASERVSRLFFLRAFALPARRAEGGAKYAVPTKREFKYAVPTKRELTPTQQEEPHAPPSVNGVALSTDACFPSVSTDACLTSASSAPGP